MRRRTLEQWTCRNGAIADALEELGDLYELDGAIVHRVLAYRTAARTVREAPVSVGALAREGRAVELAGIGETLQEKIQALCADGDDPGGGEAEGEVPAGARRDHATAGDRRQARAAAALGASGSTRRRRCARRRWRSACAR